MESSIQQGEFDVMIAIGILFMTAFALAFILFFNFSQRKLIAQKLKQQEVLLHNIIEVQETEKRRIAKDLHDEIGSQLNIINLNLHRLKRKRQDPKIFEETIRDIQELLGTTIKTTRQISHDLLPSILDKFGLIEALQELSDNYSETTVTLNFEIQENSFTIPSKSIELNIFRVIQELISNAIRHGEASIITIQFLLNKTQLKIAVIDNGKGFDTKSKTHKAGLGLSNIESRMNMIRGQIKFSSIINEGTTATLLLNFHQHNDSN